MRFQDHGESVEHDESGDDGQEDEPEPELPDEDVDLLVDDVDGEDVDLLVDDVDGEDAKAWTLTLMNNACMHHQVGDHHSPVSD